MHNSLFDEFLIAVQYLSQVLASQVFPNGSTLGKSPEVSIAKLHDDVDEPLLFNNLEEFNDVVVVELGEDLDLVIDDVGDHSGLREARR